MMQGRPTKRLVGLASDSLDTTYSSVPNSEVLQTEAPWSFHGIELGGKELNHILANPEEAVMKSRIPPPRGPAVTSRTMLA